MTKLTKKSIALLKGKNFAYLGTVNRDGSPQVTPVWIDTDGRNALVNTAMGRVKEKNMSRDPRVAVAVFDAADQYHGVSISGRVIKRITGKQAEAHIDSLEYKYSGHKTYQSRKPTEKRVILVIEPRRIAER
jgi:PPOX class probable F420-dependent enzyme